MAHLNQCTFVGNLTRDPELRYTPNGAAVTSITVAVNRRWTDDRGEKKEKVLFLRCTQWGKQAEILSQYAKKGDMILVGGELENNRWKDKDGNDRDGYELNVRDFQFLTPPPAGGPRAEAPPARNESGYPEQPPPAGQQRGPW